MQDLRKVLDDKDTRRRLDRHAQPLALADDDLGLPGGQGRVRREAVQPQHLRGPQLVEAARKYDRIVQHGTQSRSDPKWHASSGRRPQRQVRQAADRLRLRQQAARSIGFKEPKRAAQGTGLQPLARPGPEQPYHENLVHYNWHWFWDFGNGDIGNQGVHQMDIARWAMPEAPCRKSVVSLGGRFGYKDQGQTPNTQLTIFDFGGAKLSSRTAAWSTRRRAR